MLCDAARRDLERFFLLRKALLRCILRARLVLCADPGRQAEAEIAAVPAKIGDCVAGLAAELFHDLHQAPVAPLGAGGGCIVVASSVGC